VFSSSSYIIIETNENPVELINLNLDGLYYLTTLDSMNYLVVSQKSIENDLLPISYSVIDEYNPDRQYYQTSFSQYNKLSFDKKIVFSSYKSVLFSSEQTDIEFKNSILPLYLIPVKTLNTDKVSKIYLQPPQYSDEINDIVENVSAVEIENTTLDLQNFQTRYSYTEECDDAGNYLANKMSGYGLDVEVYTYAPFSFNSVSAVSSDELWICGTHGTIFHTTNGGNLWVEQENPGWPPEESIDMNDIDFEYINPESQYIGFIASDDGNIYIYEETNPVWTEVLTPIDYTINCLDATAEGLVVAGTGNGEILRSTDSGDNWEIAWDIKDYEQYGWWIRDIRIVDDLNIIVVVGSSGRIFISDDEGDTWNESETGLSSRLYSIDYNGSNTLFCATEDGIILSSTDSGQSWNTINLDTDASLRDFAFYGETGFICGDGGVLYKTYDGGATWTRQELNYYNQLLNVIINDNQVWLSGNMGLILYNPDIDDNTWVWQGNNFNNEDPHVWENIIGRITGTEYPEKVISVIAHYDSISDDKYNNAPGADDNATGTACVIECARVLSGISPDITIDFMPVSGEEVGLWGSSHYTNYLYLRGEEEIGTINMDMIGFVSKNPEDLDLYSNEPSEWLIDYFISTTNIYIPEFPIKRGVIPPDEIARYSDHNSYWNHNYDAIFGIDELVGNNYESLYPAYPYYHTTQDLYEHLTVELIRDITKATVATFASMSLQDIAKEKKVSSVFAFPNPFTPSVNSHENINFVNVPEEATVKIYNIAGQLIRTLTSNPTGTVVWYGDTETGNNCPSGVYIYLVESGGEEKSGKVAIIR
jgi:photosystem II stability/assembly factor-like uncharacterized protein